MDPQTLPSGPPAGVAYVSLPEWVDHQPPTIAAEAGQAVQGGVQLLLQDVQVDLSQPRQAWHRRSLQRVLSREGAEGVSSIVAEFDPAWQRLEVHFVRILRGSETIEHAREGSFQVFRRETDLSQKILNGRLTASFVIPDVRVGDIVEVALTLLGDAPPTGRKYSSWATFDCYAPWAESRHRLVRPNSRPIFLRSFNQPPEPKVTVRNDLEDTRWELIGQKRLEREPLMPPWTMESPTLQFSEYEAWGEVADFFAAYYGRSEPPAELNDTLEQIAAKQVGPSGRAVEWLRFVQRELRYFSLPLNEGGFAPRPIGDIWGTRFGDCKDAVELYVAGARRLGLDACPALVSTTHGPVLDRFLPGSMLFNHCIARVRLDGKSYWIDPSMTPQGGDLGAVFQPHTGWSLPIGPGVTDLERLSEASVPLYSQVREELTLGPRRNSPASLFRSVDYGLSAADELRARLAAEGTEPWATEILNYLRDSWPSTEQVGQLELTDDAANNRLKITGRYDVRNIWTGGSSGPLRLTTQDKLFSGALSVLPGDKRRTDIFLGRPRRLERHLTVNMPRPWPMRGWTRSVTAPGLTYSHVLSSSGNTTRYVKTFASVVWSLSASEAQAYKDIESLTRQNTMWLNAVERLGRLTPPPAPERRTHIAIVRGVIFMLVVVWLPFFLGLCSQPQP